MFTKRIGCSNLEPPEGVVRYRTGRVGLEWLLSSLSVSVTLKFSKTKHFFTVLASELP